MSNSLPEIARHYFEYMAERFPVMCASDEFHFIPRSQTASEQYDKMETLNLTSIQETTGTLKDIQKELNIAFFVVPNFIKQSRGWSIVQLEKGIKLLYNADGKLKSGARPEPILENLIINLCMNGV